MSDLEFKDGSVNGDGSVLLEGRNDGCEHSFLDAHLQRIVVSGAL